MAKNLQRRLKRAEKEGVILTRANRVDPNFRRRAAAGKGKGAVEAFRTYMANPETREKVNLRAQERRKALSKAELEALRERKRQSLIRLRERKKDASKRGAHLYASWIPAYEKEMLRYNQTSVSKIKATVDAFDREGFHVIWNVTQSDLRAVLSDVTETTRRANESSGWANLFSHIDKQGCLTTSSDRQMTTMDDRGAAAAVCQKLVSENLGSGENFQMEVHAVTLMNTLLKTKSPTIPITAWTTLATGGLASLSAGSFASRNGAHFRRLGVRLMTRSSRGEWILISTSEMSCFFTEQMFTGGLDAPLTRRVCSSM